VPTASVARARVRRRSCGRRLAASSRASRVFAVSPLPPRGQRSRERWPWSILAHHRERSIAALVRAESARRALVRAGSSRRARRARSRVHRLGTVLRVRALGALVARRGALVVRDDLADGLERRAFAPAVRRGSARDALVVDAVSFGAARLAMRSSLRSCSSGARRNSSSRTRSISLPFFCGSRGDRALASVIGSSLRRSSPSIWRSCRTLLIQ